MSTPAVTVRARATVPEAARLMAEEKHCIGEGDDHRHYRT